MAICTRISALLAGASLIATAAQAAGTTAATDATSASSAATIVGDIVVTAERREERLQDVPVAVSVVSADQLKNSNYTGLTNLQLLVPSLQYNSYLGGGFQVRGVGTQTVNLSTEQDVGIVIDDVVQGIPELTFAAPSYQSLTDVDRIEVLRGPQGTLFGKNSSVGVVQIVTKRPTLGAFEFDGSATAATRGEYDVQGSFNLPLTDRLAARVSMFDFHHDGFVTNVFNGKKLSGYDQYGIRGKLLWEPTSDLTIYAIAEHVHTGDTGNGGWTLRSCGSGFGAFSACATDAPLGVTPGPNNLKVALDAPTPATTDTSSGSLHIDYKIGRDTLTSVTAYLAMDSDENVDVDNSPRPILDVDSTQVSGREFTQELRLASPSDQFLEYTVGGFYYNVDSRLKNVLAGTFGFEPDNSPNLLSNGFAGLVSGGQTHLNSTTQSYAFFGQATGHLTSKLQLIGGLRYTHDDVSAGVNVSAVPGVCEFAFAFGAPCHSLPLPSPVVSDQTSASNVSGKVTVKYDFTDQVNAYATFSTGYKGPAISYAALTPFSAARPETSTAYEIGVKSELFDRRVILDADAFYEKYKNFQADTFVLNQANPAASNFELANAGGLESKGLEADATWIATPELNFTGNVAYVPTRYTDFVIQCQNQFANPATVGACFTEAGASLFNAKGYPLPLSPKVAYSLSANYHHSIGGGLLVDANLNWTWRSSTYTVVADSNTVVGGYGLLGLNVGFGREDGRWRVSAFARNLLDQHFVSGIFQTFLDNGAATGIVKPTIGYSNLPNIESERTVGVRLDVKVGS